MGATYHMHQLLGYRLWRMGASPHTCCTPRLLLRRRHLAHQDHDRLLTRPSMLCRTERRIACSSDPGHVTAHQSNPASLIWAEIKFRTGFSRRFFGHVVQVKSQRWRVEGGTAPSTVHIQPATQALTSARQPSPRSRRDDVRRAPWRLAAPRSCRRRCPCLR